MFFFFRHQIGDPKDNVRKSVREILKQTTKLYPASKVFPYLMEGLQSKNVKSRMGEYFTFFLFFPFPFSLLR